MHLIVVRHGQSGNNAAYAAAVAARPGTMADRDVGALYGDRVPEPPLTDLGVRQAAALAAAVHDGALRLRPTHLYASLMLRAVQTVAPLAAALDLPVVLRGDAHEVRGVHRYDGGTATHHAETGMSLDALREHCPSAVAGPGAPADPAQRWSGGFEAQEALAVPRARALVDDLRAAHGPSDVVVLVSHQHFARFLLAALLGLDGPPWRGWLRLDNTAHLAVRDAPNGPVVEWSNRSDHLAPDAVTN